MKILVTGATGFVGSGLVKFLSENGLVDPFEKSKKSIRVDEILACGRNQTKGARLEKYAHVKFLEFDLTDEYSVLSIADNYQNIDIIVHSAALCSEWGPWDVFYQANVVSTENIIKLCVKTGAKLVHISSCSVYVDSSYSHIKVKEDDISKDFLCHYAHTKYLSDQRVEEQYRAHSVILRPRAIVGPGDELLLPKLIDGMREKRLPLVGADVLTDLTYIDNFVDFISATAFHLFQGDGRLKHHVYNISNGEPVLFVDLFELLAKELGLPRPTRRIPYWLFVSIGRFVEFIWPFTFGLFTSKPPPVTRYIAKSIGGTLTLDISRARTDLNYRPRIPISQGLERIVDSLKASKPTLTLKVN